MTSPYGCFIPHQIQAFLKMLYFSFCKMSGDDFPASIIESLDVIRHEQDMCNGLLFLTNTRYDPYHQNIAENFIQIPGNLTQTV